MKYILLVFSHEASSSGKHNFIVFIFLASINNYLCVLMIVFPQISYDIKFIFAAPKHPNCALNLPYPSEPHNYRFI